MNSKYVYVSALIILAILVSSVSAADYNLINDNFGNKDFTISTPSDSNFNKEVDTNLDIGDLAMDVEVFENKGNNSKDLGMILYLKDSSSNDDMVSEVIDGLEKDGDIIEENDNYLIVKNKNSKDFNLFDLDFKDIFNTISNIVKGIFSNDANVNVKTDDSVVKVSSDDGIKIVDSDDTKISLSTDGLKVWDGDGENVSISTDGLEVSDGANGENVSISAKGINVSDGANGENVSISDKGVNVSSKKSDKSKDSVSGKVSSKKSDKSKDSVSGKVSISKDMVSNINDADYSIYIKDQKNNQLIVLVGDNLDLMKSMMDTASFN